MISTITSNIMILNTTPSAVPTAEDERDVGFCEGSSDTVGAIVSDKKEEEKR